MVKSAIVRVVNIEVDFPDRREACTRVDAALLRPKKDGVRVVKFIHGYGSTGIGGLLRFAVRSHLRRVRHVPEIILDSDWGNANKGITLVLLKE